VFEDGILYGVAGIDVFVNASDDSIIRQKAVDPNVWAIPLPCREKNVSRKLNLITTSHSNLFITTFSKLTFLNILRPYHTIIDCKELVTHSNIQTKRQFCYNGTI